MGRSDPVPIWRKRKGFPVFESALVSPFRRRGGLSNTQTLISMYAVFIWYGSLTSVRFIRGQDERIRSGHQDNCSFCPAYTGEHIACFFLLRRQPGFDIHLNDAAENSRGACAA